LLSDTTMSITKICYESGFNNLSNFNRQFLNQKGMPPSAFRKLMSANRRVQIAA
jgi:AraC-like DNA-binding protein